MAHHNFCKIHSALRVTPAMEAGVTDHVWSTGELVDRALEVAGEDAAPPEKKPLKMPEAAPAPVRALPNGRGSCASLRATMRPRRVRCRFVSRRPQRPRCPRRAGRRRCEGTARVGTVGSVWRTVAEDRLLTQCPMCAGSCRPIFPVCFPTRAELSHPKRREAHP